MGSSEVYRHVIDRGETVAIRIFGIAINSAPYQLNLVDALKYNCITYCINLAAKLIFVIN